MFGKGFGRRREDINVMCPVEIRTEQLPNAILQRYFPRIQAAACSSFMGSDFAMAVMDHYGLLGCGSEYR
jgi:hypothetical protein